MKLQVEQEIKAKVRNEVLGSCEIHKKERKRPMVAKKLKRQEYIKYETLDVAIT